MKILVPLDGSTTAEAALPLAAQLARAEEAVLVLLMVTDLHRAPDPAPCEPDLVPIHDAQIYLDTARRHLVAGHRDVVTAVWRGTPAAAIIRAAVEYDADQIVMTTHGRTGNQRDMFGSVADAVLRNAPMAVVVLRPQREPNPIPAGSTRSTIAEWR
jgi:nucleotide-binding universal stress UspA family protein